MVKSVDVMVYGLKMKTIKLNASKENLVLKKKNI